MNNETSWLKEQLRAGLSYTILSAAWLGRLSPEQEAKRQAKRRHDAYCVDMILAGNPDPDHVEKRRKVAETSDRRGAPASNVVNLDDWRSTVGIDQ